MVLAIKSAPSTLVTYYLEMTSPEQFRPSYADNTAGVMMMQMSRPDVGFYRFLYGSVGEQWRWRDRLLMPDHELADVLARSETSVHVLYVDATPAGYVELDKQGESTEIAYFGLRPGYMGRGLGKHLLSYGIARAWDDGAQRVFVHTCNLDSPVALENYLKRGFSIYQVYEEPMPERYM